MASRRDDDPPSLMQHHLGDRLQKAGAKKKLEGFSVDWNFLSESGQMVANMGEAEMRKDGKYRVRLVKLGEKDRVVREVSTAWLAESRAHALKEFLGKENLKVGDKWPE